jgi:hypothetical protein
MSRSSDGTEQEQREAVVNARNKLNIAYMNGALLVAGVIGVATQSLLVFGVALVVLVAVSVCAGEIR